MTHIQGTMIDLTGLNHRNSDFIHFLDEAWL